jgi:ClpP class serine protease
VRDEWKALLYSADEAMSLGLIDRIGTLDDTVGRLLSAEPDQLTTRALVPTLDTPQEPSPATGQDRTADAAIEREIHALNLQ